MQNIVRALVGVTLLAIMAVTLSPVRDRPYLGFAPSVDRAAAFFLLGLLLGFSFRRHWPVALVVILAGAWGLEAAQMLTPDRDARIVDALQKTGGALAGFGLSWLLSKISRGKGSE